MGQMDVRGGGDSSGNAAETSRMDQGALALVTDEAKAFQKVQLKVVWAWAIVHFRSVGTLNITERMCGRAAADNIT